MMGQGMAQPGMMQPGMGGVGQVAGRVGPGGAMQRAQVGAARPSAAARCGWRHVHPHQRLPCMFLPGLPALSFSIFRCRPARNRGAMHLFVRAYLKKGKNSKNRLQSLDQPPSPANKSGGSSRYKRHGVSAGIRTWLPRACLFCAARIGAALVRPCHVARLPARPPALLGPLPHTQRPTRSARLTNVTLSCARRPLQSVRPLAPES